MIIELVKEPFWALLTFVKLAVGLSVVSYGLIAYKDWMPKLAFIACGLLVTFV